MAMAVATSPPEYIHLVGPLPYSGRIPVWQLSPSEYLDTTDDRSTPYFNFEAGHTREMLDIVRDQRHPLGYRV